MKSEEQIREIATDAILLQIDNRDEAELLARLEAHYDYLSREDIDLVFAAVADAKVSVSW